jgi:ADP-heptose:LPS heptosyltransferase
MGDLIMCTPAFRAIKEKDHARITLLTSSEGAKIARFIPEINNVVTADLPWYPNSDMTEESLVELQLKLKAEAFDLAIFSSTFSQTILPSALLTYEAGIPQRIGYCRENPYDLLTHWIPEEEPLLMIKHQVERELKLVGEMGYKTDDTDLSLTIPEADEARALAHIKSLSNQKDAKYMVIHPGVTDIKRRFPLEKWKELCRYVALTYKGTIIFSGTAEEKELCNDIIGDTRGKFINMAGSTSISEYLTLIKQAELIISVNTSAIHVAAAFKTPSIVLYAETNPQHWPWNSPTIVIPFPVKADFRSKNGILQYVAKHYYEKETKYPELTDIQFAMNYFNLA